MARFFVSGAIGFEIQLINELHSIWFLLADLDGLPTRSNPPEMTIVDGGLEFDCDLHLGLQLNYFSKQAYRILLRVGHFQARFFDQFEKQLSQINWTGYLTQSDRLKFNISFSKSRLNNEKNLIEACENVFKKKGFQFSEDATRTIFIRIVRDHAVISLDTTGEHLHFRGYRTQQGEAPIRENLAALMWSFFPDQPGKNDLIFDPFCGSGTLLFEYLIQTRPNFSRSYSFLTWPSAPALMKSPTFHKNFRWIEDAANTPEILGCDLNPETIKKAQSNQKNLETQFGIAVPISWLITNCCDLKMNQRERLFVIANPPYGERLDDRGAMNDLNICLKQNQDLFRAIDLLVLQPLGRVPSFESLVLKNKIPFTNQGLKLNLLHYAGSSKV